MATAVKKTASPAEAVPEEGERDWIVTDGGPTTVIWTDAEAEVFVWSVAVTVRLCTPASLAVGTQPKLPALFMMALEILLPIESVTE